jgi:hypothetical protein
VCELTVKLVLKNRGRPVHLGIFPSHVIRSYDSVLLIERAAELSDERRGKAGRR